MLQRGYLARVRGRQQTCPKIRIKNLTREKRDVLNLLHRDVRRRELQKVETERKFKRENTRNEEDAKRPTNVDIGRRDECDKANKARENKKQSVMRA